MEREKQNEQLDSKMCRMSFQFQYNRIVRIDQHQLKFQIDYVQVHTPTKNELYPQCANQLDCGKSSSGRNHRFLTETLTG